jgi:hypothetical protein
VKREIVRHATALSAAHEGALDTGFHVGERVRTIDGLIGRVVMITESWAPGNNAYQVILDSGMGGGTYLASQLRPVPEGYGGGHQQGPYLPAGVTAALEAEADLESYLASDYYPEMGDILHDRPDPGRQISVIGALVRPFEDTWSTDHNPAYHPGPMPRLYHGTNHEFGVGHYVESGHPTHYPGAYDGMEEEAGTRVHATPHVEQAWQHADNAVHEHGGAHHVYEVEPTGRVTWGDEAFPEDFESDDEMNEHATRMSQSPFRVVREVPYRGEPLPFTQRHQAAAGWSYDGNIMGRILARSPGGDEHELWTRGMGIQSIRHPEDVPVPLYHGSDREFAPGEQIEPGHPGNFVSRMKHVYMTEQPESDPGGYKGARGYGRHVYEVQPTDWYGHRRDARGAEWATEGPLNIVREVPDPRHEHVAAFYADGIDPREQDYNGEPEVGGVFWGAPAQQQFTDEELGQPEPGPIEMAGPPIPGGEPEEEPEEGEGEEEPGEEEEGPPPFGAEASLRDDKSDRWHEYNQQFRPDTLHRGIHVRLPDDLHAYVHDESIPRESRAQALSQHFADSGGLGMHWTPHVNIANRSAWNAADASGDEDDGGYGAYDDDEDREQPRTTDVMFHARRPGRRNEIRDPEVLDDYAAGWKYSKDEDETTLKPGSPLRLEGISWKPHEPEYPNEPFEHVDFSRPMRHTARVPWTGEEREMLHSWQEHPTATAGDFVNSADFTNKAPEPAPGPDPEAEFAEMVGPRAFTEMTARLAARAGGTFYHGTLNELPVGHVLTPEGANQAGRRWSMSSPEHVFYTDWAQHASAYARPPFYAMHGTRGHVYEVEPLDESGSPVAEHEPDPDARTRKEHSFRTRGGLRVVRELGEDDVGTRGKPLTPRSWHAMTAAHAPHGQAADQVYRQLSKKFPPKSISWVHDAQWEGPHRVPLGQVDFSNRDSWEAQSGDKKVRKFKKKITKKEEAGKDPKPAILISKPGRPDPQVIADGHHRAIAEEELEAEDPGREGLYAWTAHVPEDEGPWDQMHSSQEPDQGDALDEPGDEQGPPGADADADSLEFGDLSATQPLPPPVTTGLPPYSQGGTPGPRTKNMTPVQQSPAFLLAHPELQQQQQQEPPPGEEDEEDEGDGKDKDKALDSFEKAAGSASFRFEFCASWRDVVAKAERIVRENGVRITALAGSLTVGEVKGDHATYETGLQYYPGRGFSVMAYSCGCPWATFWQNPDQPGRFAGRMCSHAYALSLAAKARGVVRSTMFPELAGWPEQVVVKSEPPWHPSDKEWGRQWTAPMTRAPVLSSLIADTLGDREPVQVPAVTAARVLIDAGEDPAAVAVLLRLAGLETEAVSRPLSWDEIGERHPALYGDPEVHGEKARGADGEGVGWAANILANDRPEDPDAQNTGSWDMMFHREKVSPKHIDYARHGMGDPRVRYAREGYALHPEQVPPTILVHRHGVYQVADGHHRAEGAAEAGRKVDAYVHYSAYEDVPFSRDEDGEERKGPFHGAEPHPGVAAHRNYFTKEADQANAPWGSQDVIDMPPQQPYGATSPPEKDQDPGSYGFLSGPDPDNWGEIQDNSAIQQPLTNEAAAKADPLTLDQPDIGDWAGEGQSLAYQEPDAGLQSSASNAIFLDSRRGTARHGTGPVVDTAMDTETGPVTHERGESHPYSDQGNPGPSTSMAPRDPGGLRMEETRRAAWLAFTESVSTPEKTQEDARLWVACPGCGYRGPGNVQRTQALSCPRCSRLVSHVGPYEHMHAVISSAAGPQLDGALAELKDEPEPALDPEGLTAADPSMTYPAQVGAGISGHAQYPDENIGQNPGMGSLDEPSVPQDSSIQSVGTQQWSGGDYSSGDLAHPEDQGQQFPAEDEDMRDIVAAFQRSAAARQYSGDGAARVDADIAGAARAYLQKQADALPADEADELIREGRGTRARNLDLLDLQGTHYQDDPRLDDHDEDVLLI